MMILALLKLLLHRKPSAVLGLVCVTAEVCNSNYQSLDVIEDYNTLCCITEFFKSLFGNLKLILDSL